MVPAELSVTDLAGANAAAAQWCAEVKRRRAFGDLRHPSRMPQGRAGTAGCVAVTAADRPEADQPQGRQAVLCAVRLGPLLGAEPADRRDSADQHSGRRVQTLEPFTGEIVAEHALVGPGEPACRTRTTAPRGRTSRVGRRGPTPPRRNGSSPSVKSQRRSAPAPRLPGCRNCRGRSARSSRCGPRTATRRCSRRRPHPAGGRAGAGAHPLVGADTPAQRLQDRRCTVMSTEPPPLAADLEDGLNRLRMSRCVFGDRMDVY